MTLNWQQAVSYYDVVKKQSVVEVPVSGGAFSRYIINPNGVAIGNLQGLPIKKLIVVRDSLHNIDYAIMKINATIPYLNASTQITANSYHKMDTLFEGIVTYVDILDRIKGQYYLKEQKWHLIDSTVVHVKDPDEVQNRWEIICVHVYLETYCRKGLHLGNQEGCLVGGGGTYDFELCYEVNNGGFSGPGDGSGYVFPLIPGATVGGSGNNNNMGCDCVHTLIDEYWTNVSPVLQPPYGNYWFNINHVVVGANCRNGNFNEEASGYKVYLVPGQGSNGEEILYTVNKNYSVLEVKTQLGTCKYRTVASYSSTIVFTCVYYIGGAGVEGQWVRNFESVPTFIFD